MNMLEVVNRWAWKSVSANNPNRTSRVFYRCLYRTAARLYRAFSRDWRLRLDLYMNGCSEINTYVWPYCVPEFANWPEEEGLLVSDSCGFVVRHSTSYCAQKLHEISRRWLKHGRGERYDARDWLQLLDINGYDEIAREPKTGNSYIGIMPHMGEYGLVVWFEYMDGPLAVFSTYRDGKYFISREMPDRVTWVRVG